VRGGDGTPVPGAVVYGESDAQGVQAAEADEEGRFVVRRLVPGPVRLRAFREGQLPEKQPVTEVRAGGAEVVLVLAE
jgi:hypothetical protein